MGQAGQREGRRGGIRGEAIFTKKEDHETFIHQSLTGRPIWGIFHVGQSVGVTNTFTIPILHCIKLPTHLFKFLGVVQKAQIQYSKDGI